MYKKDTEQNSYCNLATSKSVFLSVKIYFNPFNVTGLFLYPLTTSDVSTGYRKIPVAWNKL